MFIMVRKIMRNNNAKITPGLRFSKAAHWCQILPMVLRFRQTQPWMFSYENHPQTPRCVLNLMRPTVIVSPFFVWQENPPITQLQLHPHAWRFQEVILNGISAFPHVSLHRSTTRSKTKPAANDKYITSLGNSGERALDHKITAVRTRRSGSF